jgi:hypothetical protein
MKSYILSPIRSHSAAVTVLSLALPGQTEPWLLKNADGDAIAYFSLVEDTVESCAIQADVSGRYYNRDTDVIAIL